MFMLPQFSRTALNNTLNLNGFQLAFGFKDIVEVPGRFYVFLSFVFGILSAAVLLVLQFVKKLKNRAAILYIAAAILSLANFILLIIYLATAKNIDAGNALIHNYYFKNIIESSNKDILRGGFTVWFWLGIVFHQLTVGGCCYGIKASR